MTEKATKTGRELEKRVANAYRQMGARKVEHDILLAGNQIDVYVELETPGRLVHRIAVEVKDWFSPVGIDIVNRFAVRVGLLCNRRLIDQGVIVSVSGFSRQAREAAKDHGIRLFEPADLDAMIPDSERRGQPPVSTYTPPSPPNPITLPAPGPLPPGSRVPFLRNRIFTGRVESLKTLAHLLLYPQVEKHGGPTIVTQAVQGMGGVGKTQLAVEFAYRYGRFFHGVHWLNAAQSHRIDVEIAACGEAMSLPYWPAKLPDQVAYTLNAWRRGGLRLAVLDNLEDVATARKWLGRLNGTLLCILITARSALWPPDMALNLVELDVFTLGESSDFLRQYLPHERDSDSDLKALAKRLGRLPMALELAGRYLAYHRRLTVDAYLENLEPLNDPSMRGWWKEWGSPTDHNLDLDATFALSWKLVTHEGARRLFPLIGYCAPNQPIPFDLLERASGLDPDICGEAVGALLGRGLLKMEDPDVGPIIHPLLAEYACSIPYPERESPLLPLANALGAVAQETTGTGLPIDFAPLRPHVEAVATAAEAAGLEQAVPLWGSLGDHFKTVADYTQAQQACERALAMAEQIYRPSHPQVATCASNLGDVLKERGDLEGALDRLEQALMINEAHFGSNHPKVAFDLRSIGCLLKDLGHIDRARAALEQALEGFQQAQEVNEDILGPSHPDLARHIYSIGWIYKDLGDLMGARSCFSQVLEIDEATYGRDSPKIVCDLNSIGLVLKDLGDWGGAQASFERALEIDEMCFGRDHPHVARDLENLGWLFRDLGELVNARVAFELALEIYQGAYGEENPRVAELYNDLGLVLLDLGDYNSARKAFEHALAIDKVISGPDHPSVARSISNVGRVLKAQDDLEGAVECFRQALTMGERYYCGLNHPNVAHHIRDIGWMLKDVGYLAGARYCFSRALAMDEATFGPESPEIIDDVSGLGWVLKDLGKVDEAVDSFKRALLIDQETFGFNHPNVARDIRNVGWMLKDKGNGDLAAARYCFCRALEIVEAVFGSNHPRVVPDVRSLGYVLRDLGNLEGALDCLKQALTIEEARFGPDNLNVAYAADSLGQVLCDSGDLAGAREHFERAVRIFEKTLPMGHPHIKTVQQNLARTV